MGTHYPIPMNEKEGAVWLAGEASGDFIASLVLPEVMRRMNNAPQYGVGGSRMKEVGFHAWHDIQELSVRGYVEVLMHLPRLVKLRSQLVQRFADSMPKVFVGVDAPDFNLGIERKLRQKGIPTVHFVGPSIWAWRPERIHDIRRSVDHTLLVFPFEEKIYKEAGIPATYVGHPLANIIPMTPDQAQAKKAFGIEDDLPVVAVLPGSRVDEVKGCAPAFFAAVEKVCHRLGDVHVLVPAADEKAREDIIFLTGQFPRVMKHLHIEVGNSHRMMEAADAVLLASGTATLEAALYKKPMVVGYKMPALTGMIMQRKAVARCVSLPNILLGENVVPEFLQYFCEADQISYALEDALTNDKRRNMLRERFSTLHESLIADTPNLVADVVETVASRRRY